MVNVLLPAAAAAAFVSQTWDFVVLGGGTAGLVVATRLSENPSVRVAVLEAGIDRSNDTAVTVAGNWSTVFTNPAYTWNFSSVPQIHAANRLISQPRGKLVGGSSGVNAMEWRIASAAEYDAWADLGNPGWDFNGLLPFFKMAENFTAQRDNPLFPSTGDIRPDKGTRGPVIVSLNIWYSSLVSKFLDALHNLGFQQNSDPDGGIDAGIANIPRSVDNAHGTRQYSAVTYLRQVQNRSNIQVLTGAQATGIILDSAGALMVATAVKFIADGEAFIVRARKEVIVSAGAFQTPHILELSGIGMPSVLDRHGLPSRIDLPVGENLLDHTLLNIQYELTPAAQDSASLISVPEIFPITNETSPATMMTGTPMLWTSMRSVASMEGHQQLSDCLDKYLRHEKLTALERAQYTIQRQWLSQGSSGVPEAEIIFPSIPGTPGLPLPDGSFAAWMPSSHIHPLSRGSVHALSSDPLMPPAIDPNYLYREFDILALVQIINFTRTVSKSGLMASQIKDAMFPPSNITSSESLASWVKSNVGTQYHPAGTAAMAPREKGGVVDTELLVYGTENLRVIDASIIPMTVGATTQATVYAIAEKGAALIKAKYGL